MATTATTIIVNALSSVGVLGENQIPQQSDLVRGFTRLNDLIDAWANETLYAGSTVEYVLQLSGQQSITISPTGDIVAPVPAQIQDGFIRSGDFDYGFEVVTYPEYASIGYKTQPGPWPSVAYFNSSTGVVTFYPIPSGGELHLPVLGRLTEFADLTTSYTLQAGARKALSYSLAEELADDYLRDLSPQFQRRAAASRRVLKRANLSIPILSVPYCGGGVGNIMNPADPDIYIGGNAGTT